jgi:hypothetical protein
MMWRSVVRFTAGIIRQAGNCLKGLAYKTALFRFGGITLKILLQTGRNPGAGGVSRLPKQEGFVKMAAFCPPEERKIGGENPENQISEEGQCTTQ